MATFADISELRLRVKDPLGAIALLSVANEAARLAVTAPARQTAYLQADTGVYYLFDSDLAAWEPQDLPLSDVRLSLLIDLHGLAKAAPRAVKDIMAELGRKLYVSKTTDGAGSTDYQNLTTMLNFYRALASSMEEDIAVDTGASTGRMFRIRSPRIGGGMCG